MCLLCGGISGLSAAGQFICDWHSIELIYVNGRAAKQGIYFDGYMSRLVFPFFIIYCAFFELCTFW